MNLVSLGLGILSLLLLGINVVGLLRRPRQPQPNRRPPGYLASAPDQPPSGRPKPARSVRQLLAALPAVAPAPRERGQGERGQGERGRVGPFCERLTQLLVERFEHGYGRYTPWSNYVCWLAGLAVPRLADIQNTDVLLRYSDQALCGQLAQAFVDVARRRAVPARLAALHGHVVAEAYYDGSWHGYDADYGVVYSDPDVDPSVDPDVETGVGGRVVAVADLLASPSLASRIYANHRLPRDNQEVLDILARGQVTYLPDGAHAVPRIARLQRVAEWTKWWLPVGLLLLAAALGWLG